MSIRRRESALTCKQELGRIGIEVNIIDFINAPTSNCIAELFKYAQNHSITSISGNHCSMKLGMLSAKALAKRLDFSLDFFLNI